MNTCSVGASIHLLISVFLLHVSVVNNHLYAVHKIICKTLHFYNTISVVMEILGYCAKVM